ncbi:hypothetical protein BGZ95_004154 [Linnemannia exigua]|uniref:Protein FRA10AC1 n=1 Tax=Linnemannia exigua TaxID=604196 RepID=A0AAD4D3T6_9FUNG|nr:hypothetical protein BGZ95_004154 [Linnemannia exigua]
MPNPQPQAVYRQGLGGMDAWTRHQHFIENYTKFYNGKPTPQEDHGITERDILQENHRFLRSEADDEDLTWEKRIAKKYYDKLFKEYALVELKYYKEGRIALRWRNQNEVVRGKGQFTCGSLRCDGAKGLESWEINFGYLEQGEKKNALVKVRLCEKCSYKLNYKSTHKRANPNREDELISSSSVTSPTAIATASSKERSRTSSGDRGTKANASEPSRHHSRDYESSTRSKRKNRSRSREMDTELDAKSSRYHHRDDRESSKRGKSSSRRDEDKADRKDRAKEAERSWSSSFSSSHTHREHRLLHSTGDGHDKQDVGDGRNNIRSKSNGGKEESSRSDVKDGRGANYMSTKEATVVNRTMDREVAVEKGNVKRDKDEDRANRPALMGEFEQFFKGLFE